MDPTPVDIGDLDFSGLSREDILAALIDAAIIGAPDEAEFSTPETSAGELPAHENAAGKLAPPENSPAPGLSKSTVAGEAPFYSPDQLRDERGRWTAGGSGGGMTREDHAARREAASGAIRDYLAATHQPTRQETAALAGHLATLTVKQLHELRKEHGLKDPRLVKEDFVNALHGYFEQHRQKQAVLARGREDEARRQAAKQEASSGRATHEQVLGEFNRLKAEKYVQHGMVPIHELRAAVREKYGEASASHGHLDAALHDLRRSRQVRLVALGDASQVSRQQLADSIRGENEIYHSVETHPDAPAGQPEPHQALAAAVAGKGGFTQPFRRGPYVAVRHDPTGHVIEAEAGNHSGRFAVKDPSNVVHSRHDTAEAAVAAVQSANRLGTGDSTVERELRDRAVQAGKGLPEPNEDAKAGRIPAPSVLRAAGTRPSDVAKSYGLPHDFYDDQRKLYDRNSGFPTMRGEVHVNDKYDPQGKVAAAQDARDRAAKRGDLTGATRKYHEEQIRKALAEAVARASRGRARFSEEGGTVDFDSPPGEGGMADQAGEGKGGRTSRSGTMVLIDYTDPGLPASVPFSADPGGQDEGRFVLKDAPVVFRAGPYDFPPEKGGPFEMTPEDIREALEDFPEDGVPITNEHNSRCIFHGKLGWFLRPQATPDYATFGGKVKLAKPVLDLLGGGPIKLSANWDRATKRLKDVSLVAHPRINDAALFAAFAKDADEGVTEKYVTPHGRASMQAMHDMAARSGALCKSSAGVPPGASDRSAAAKPREAGMAEFTSEHERDAMQAIHDTATGMGASCAVAKLPKRAAALEAMMSEYVPTPAPSAREAELERQVAQFKEQEAQFASRLAAVEKANQEAQFAARTAQFAAEAEAFAGALVREGRLFPVEKPHCVLDYTQSARDDLLAPAEVHFSDDKGAPVKGTRLDACKARWKARRPHGLDVERVSGPLTALFGGESKDPEDAETERLRKSMEKRAAAENARNGSRR